MGLRGEMRAWLVEAWLCRRDETRARRNGKGVDRRDGMRVFEMWCECASCVAEAVLMDVLRAFGADERGSMASVGAVRVPRGCCVGAVRVP